MPSSPNSHAHIPKRATQHSTFLCGSETLPPALKPGQKELYRQNLYNEETRPLKEPYLYQDQVSKSEYMHDMSSLLTEDFVNRTTPYRPPDAQRQLELGLSLVTTIKDGPSAQHWKSVYTQASSDQATQEFVEFGRPQRDIDDDRGHQSMLTRGANKTSYQEDFGTHGSNPRDKILPSGGLTFKRDLDHGTTKGTCHLPGYQGYIPSNTCLAEVARVARGEVTRCVDKTNIDQTYHTNMIGYAGHEPRSSRNDQGGRQLTLRTVAGHDYQDPTYLFSPDEKISSMK